MFFFFRCLLLLIFIKLPFCWFPQDRAKIQVKRRPPTRQARRAAATTNSASDATLFGSTTNDEASASARVSWGGFPTQEGLEKSEVDSPPQRTATRDSDMSDEFFGFTSSGSSKVAKEPDDPLAGGLFSSSVGKPNVSKASELFSDDSDLFAGSSEKTNKKEPAVVNALAANEGDIFSVSNANDISKNKPIEPLVGKDTSASLFTAESPGDDIFSTVSDKSAEKKLEPSSEKKPNKAAEAKISSPLDNDELFSAVQKDDNDTEKIKGIKPEVKVTAKEKAPALDEDLFASSSAKKETKPEKKESERATVDKKISSPLEDDDDDLFTVSTPAKKEIKTVADSAVKKTASPQTTKKTATKASSILNVSIFYRPHSNGRSSFFATIIGLVTRHGQARCVTCQVIVVKESNDR